MSDVDVLLVQLVYRRCCGRALKDDNEVDVPLPFGVGYFMFWLNAVRGGAEGTVREAGPPSRFLPLCSLGTCGVQVVVPASSHVCSHPGPGLLPAGVSPWHPQWVVL